ncbi:cobyrinate a,c-diamide synthase [Mycobacterium sp. NPDC006124]|uniref:cobyrinate a,c-diamide synthase n=1 Tax=Mycobacterium sp. NPDC006124 TaxID=3156729 RepID=UPI0033BD86D8
MVATTPAIVVAAPSSGSGKTTVATGLMGALRRSGHRVAPFKVGPDFIDPGYHALAAGRPGRNLDPVLVTEARIGPLYRHGCTGADIAVVEGVMGLFDGRIDPDSDAPVIGSTAHVASSLGAPVVLVVDGSGQSQSVAALVHGFSTFDSGIRIGGVILNRVGSPRHEQVLRQACDRIGMPVLGAIPRASELSVPSRHLGLVTAVEHGRRARLAIDAMTDLVARHVDLAAVAALAAANVAAGPWDPLTAVGGAVDGSPVVAMAAGRAFSFGYAEHVEMLRAAGAEVVEFDPITEALPAETDALILPGGFPEQHLPELSANVEVRRQIRQLAEHSPIYAECAGLTYLMTKLDDHPMCDVLQGTAQFTKRLTLGYRHAVASGDSVLHPSGHAATGHEFHRTKVEFSTAYPSAWTFRVGDVTMNDGAILNKVHAAYLHTHPAGQPTAVRSFVASAVPATTQPIQ